jgi:NADPH2:quinone reductase
MRAASYSQAGPAADVLAVTDIDAPTPGPGEVQVKLEYSGINPTDIKARNGSVARVIDEFLIPHHDGSGVIAAVGEGVDQGRVGERVWVMNANVGSRYGTAAEICVVNSDNAQPLPANIDMTLGATLGVPAVTAAYCLFADGPIRDSHVLISGGAGAVGRAAIQLAKWGGARVTASVSSDAKAAIAREAGADVVVNYKSPSAVESLRGQGITRVIEVNLTDNLELDIAISQPGMKIVSYAADGEDPVIPRRALMTAGITIEFMLLFTVEKMKYVAAVESVNQALTDGALTPPPTAFYSLEEIAQAHLALEAGSTERILLRI